MGPYELSVCEAERKRACVERTSLRAGGENALWRKGSFEVMNMNTGELLYSKMATGTHLVDGKGGPEGALGQFVDTVLANQ